MVHALLSVVQMVIATLVAALTAYLSLWALEASNRRLGVWEELARGNKAVGAVAGAAIVALAIVLRPAIVLPKLPDLPLATNPGAGLLAVAIQLALGILFGVASLGFASWLLTRLTGKLDEVAELRAGNLAVAALLSATLISVALLASVAVEELAAAVAIWVL